MIPCDIAGCKNFIRHIENRFSQYFILFCFLKCSLGFVERRLSYRLRYICPVCFLFRGGKTPSWDLWLGRGLTRGVDKCVLFHLHFYYIRQGSWDSYNLCVCLSVSRLTANVMLWLGLPVGSIDLLSVVVRTRILIPITFPLPSPLYNPSSNPYS